jgi:hypothetical protein
MPGSTVLCFVGQSHRDLPTLDRTHRKRWGTQAGCVATTTRHTPPFGHPSQEGKPYHVGDFFRDDYNRKESGISTYSRLKGGPPRLGTRAARESHSGVNAPKLHHLKHPCDGQHESSHAHTYFIL